MSQATRPATMESTTDVPLPPVEPVLRRLGRALVGMLAAVGAAMGGVIMEDSR